nr:ATP-binding protein [uncultured Dyadobacter sp.]
MKIPLSSLSRALLIWTILLVVILGSFVFVILLTRVKSRTIRENIHELQKDMNGYQKIDTCISILYVAENNSRLFITTQDSSYLNAFTGQLQTVSNILTEFETERANRSSALSGLIESKRESNDEFIRMKILVDSLLSLSVQRGELEQQQEAKSVRPTVRVKKTSKVDSVVVADTSRRKKGLLKRIADAIANKGDDHITKERTKVITERDSLLTSRLLARELDLSRYDEYTRVRKQLNEAEQRLLFLNGELFASLQATLKRLKGTEEKKVKIFRSSLLAETSNEFEKVNRLLWGAAIVVFLMTIIIVRNVLKLYRNDATILRYATLTAESAQKKGEFLAQVTHEIRTPLNAIIGFSQLIETNRLDGQTRESVEAIQSSSRILITLVNELLDFSKLERGKLTLQYHAFSPVALFDEVISVLSVLADEKHIVIESKLNILKDSCLQGDEFRIKQVMINLLNNAIKFTPAHGKIVVEAMLEKTDPQKKLLKFSVKDSGIGIAPQHLKVIFEDFSQVDGVATSGKQGTGLGLAICKRIVELHGGTISVESAIGKGSEFKVAIPMGVAEKINERATRKAVPASLSRNFKGKKALVADDTKLNLVLMSRFLEKYGISYDLVTSGDDALELFEKQPYDLVITDIHMPEMDGMELTRRIRAHVEADKAGIPVIGFTGDSSDRDKNFYAGLGINGVLGKPFSEGELLLLLEQVFYPGEYPENNLQG